MTQGKSYYSLLQIEPGASQDVVESAYRRMALRFHPDLNHSREATFFMQEINVAYDTLRNPGKRADYDKTLTASSSRTVRQPHYRARTQTRQPAQQRAASQTIRRTPPPAAPKPKFSRQTVQQEQLVIFYLNQQTFGLTIEDVQTIMMMQTIKHDERIPSFIEGYIQAGGKDVPVIDLRKQLGFSPDELDKDARIILIRIEKVSTGLIVDSVENFLKIPGNTVISPPSMTISKDADFIKGFARIGFNLVTLLNLRGLFTTEQMEILQYFA